MSKFYSGERSIRGYLNEIEKYYELMKKSKDFDDYAHYLTLMKNQIEFLSKYIYEYKKFDEFESAIYLTDIDTEMALNIIKTVESNIAFIRKGLSLTKFKTKGETKWQLTLTQQLNGMKNVRDKYPTV